MEDFTIFKIKQYTEIDGFGYYTKKAIYTKIEDILRHVYGNTTKDLFDCVEVEGIEKTLPQLYKEINDKMLVVFPINSTTLLNDMNSYIKMGFTVVLMRHKDFSRFKKAYENYIVV